MRRPLRFTLAWVIVLVSLGAVVWAWNQWVVPVGSASAASVPSRPPTTGNTTVAVPTANAPVPPIGAFSATVQWVSDGDTIGAATADRRDVTVRLIGIDSPETKKPNTPVQCFGPEATAYLQSLLPRGSHVTAAFQQVRRDKYQRDLWDVWLPNGTFVQATMVSEGFARADRFGGTDRYADYLARLESSARSRRVGLWGACPRT